MEVKGTCTPACQREHLPVNQWEMMWALWPSCLICKELFYANVSGQRQTVQYSGTKAQVYQGKKDNAKYKNRMKITEWKIKGVWHLWHFSPTCPFCHPDAGLISWSSSTMCWTDTKKPRLFSFKWLANILKMSPSKASLQTAFSAPFPLLFVRM